MNGGRRFGKILLAMLMVVGAWLLATPPSGGPDEPSHVVRSAGLVRGQLDPTPINARVDGFELPGHVGFPNPACFAFQPDVSAACLSDLVVVDGDQLRPTQSADYPIWGHLAPGLGSFLPSGWSSIGARLGDAIVPMLLLGASLFAASRHGWAAASGVLLSITVPVWFIVAVVNPSGMAIAGGIAIWTAAANGGRGRDLFDWAPSRLDQLLLAAGWAALVLPRRDGLVYAAIGAALAILIFDIGVGHLRRSVSRWTWGAIVASTLATLVWASQSSASSSKLLFAAPLAPIAAIGARRLWRAASTTSQRVALGVSGGVAAIVGSYLVVRSTPAGFDSTVLMRTMGRTGADIRETVGLVGWLDTAVPESMVLLWMVAVGLVAAGALIADRARAWIGAVAILGTGIWLSWVLTLVQNDESGTYWQGRYYLPLLVGVPIVLSTARLDGRNAVRLGKGAVAISLIVANVAVAAAMRRWGVGEQGSMLPWRWGTYDTVVPPVALLGLHAAGTGLLWRSVDSVAGPADAAAQTVSFAPTSELADGVNLLGYHSAASGLGVAARRIHTALTAAGVPVSRFDVELTDSPAAAEPGAFDDEVVRRTTIAVVTAPELPAALRNRPELGRVDRVIGYWFWEVETVPDAHAAAFDLVDEIWAPTTFVADAYGRRSDVPPVVHQPLHLSEPIADPAVTATWRERLAPNDEFVFLVTLDLFSIVERKNPFAAIEAFARLVESPERPSRLVIKTLNGDQRPAGMRRLSDAIGASPAVDRIELIDGYVSDADMTGIVAAADCLVSLHRGEGLGLHLADAMWLGTPVVATRYSGNLDFMDDSNSLLVDAQLVPARHGEGAYPDGVRWADPDTGQATVAMQRVVSDQTVGTSTAVAAQRSMSSQPSALRHGLAAAATIEQPIGVATQPTPDFNDVLHRLRTEALTEMPAGANRLLSVGCAGRWYFDWVEAAYGTVNEHVGIEFFSPKPDDLPANATWIADTASNLASIDDSSADLLFSGQNIEHLWPVDVVGFLTEANRVLSTGGSIVMDSPNRTVTERLGWSQPEHTIEFTADEIIELVEIAGFSPTRIIGLWDCAGADSLEPKTAAEVIARSAPIAADRIDDAFVWWLEATRVGAPDVARLTERVEEIFAVAWPERMSRRVVNDRARHAESGVGLPRSESGVIVHGPHSPLSAGEYTVSFDVVVDGAVGEMVGACIVQAGADRCAVIELIGNGHRQRRRVDIAVEFDEMTFGVHGRVDASGAGELSADPTISISPERPVGH